MGFNFPNSPTGGQTYTPAGGQTYTWNGFGWQVMSAGGGGAGAGLIVSDTPPADPVDGQLWYESDSGSTYVWVTDADSSQWVQQNVMPSGGASDNVSTAADMSIGFRTGGNRFVVNDKADLTGTDVMTVGEAGNVTSSGSLVASNGFLVGSTTAAYLGNLSGAGTVYLRPNGAGSPTGQTVIDSAGHMTVAGSVFGAYAFQAQGTTVVLSTNAAGNIYLRPNGNASATGQTAIASSGLVTTGSQINVVAATHVTGGNDGLSLGAGVITQSRTLTTAVTHHAFYNPNGSVGYISTNASATAYNTSSDERLKEFSGPLSGEDAIAVIRADPVRRFTWIGDGTAAVGWGAQTSYAVSPDLASPPPEEALEREPGDEGFHPWGMDQGKRTPYLWAALTHALDRIDQLEARLAALEGGA